MSNPENLDNPAAPDADLDGPGATGDPDHGVPGDAEPMPEGDGEAAEDVPEEDDSDAADDEPEEVDETVADDPGTPSEMDEEDGQSDG